MTTPTEASLKLAREFIPFTSLSGEDEEDDVICDLALLLDRVRAEALEEEFRVYNELIRALNASIPMASANAIRALIPKGDA